jgi:hypothetical protein
LIFPDSFGWLLGVGLAQALLVGCDAGEAPLALGPRPRIQSYQPKSGEGLDCDPTQAGCGFPLNRPLAFAFDRWLLPSTATRQSIRVGLVATNYTVFFEPMYDLITRTVGYRPTGGWDEGFVFDLQLYDSTTPEAEWGFRSYDGLLLDPTGLPEHILFRVGAPRSDLPAPRTVHTACRDALQAFAGAGCSASNCHRSYPTVSPQKWPRAGLALDSGEGLTAAIGRVARATDRGAESGASATSSERFGVNLPLISAGEPSLSLAMYRMLLGRDAFHDQDGSYVVRPPAAEELERARSWFGVMGEMPPREVGWSSDASPIDIVNTIQNWIWDGATTTDCN